MNKRGFDYFSEYDLDFCKQHILNIVSGLKYSTVRYLISSSLQYSAYLDYNLYFRQGGPEAGRRVLVVHLFTKGSRTRYYSGSYRHKLPTIVGRRFLYEVPNSTLTIVGY
ncbi:hypothetical protein BJ875DRAFT_429596 [Amylocarpus encephaloides]|uniref:Uncharacterized protein n=1 Tax=Amylocarpus encephaloides TaxID=45428 RepID=A0A9P7YDL4_9HELO|nr:hypothetical protein BJ875DRAFT_429596 [Amylocarpus encephaloides]